jgi:hypothetical protein
MKTFLKVRGGEQMDEITGWAAKAFLVIVVFITVFAVVNGSAADLGAAAFVLAVVAGLGALAALFGALKMIVNWPQ